MSTLVPSLSTQPKMETLTSPLLLNETTLASEIFVIDDEELVIDTLKHHLTTAGFRNTHGFTDSGEAIDTLRFVRPDVILTDIHMPDVSGSFLTKLIRTFAHLRDVPVVVITSDQRPETEEAIRRKGADVVLTKPVQPDLLIQYIAETLKRSQIQQQEQQQQIKQQQQQKAHTDQALKIQESRLRRLCRPNDD